MQKHLYADLYQLEDKHWWHKAKRENAISLLLRFLTKDSPKILDMGCGAGKNVEELSKIGSTWGIDNSHLAIAYCRKRGLKTISLGNAELTNFSPNSFDVVTLLDVLEHTDDSKALKEIDRILKPGGLLVISVPAFPILWSQWDVVLHHKRRYTKKSLLQKLDRYSLDVLKISYMFSFLFLPVYIVRLIKSKISSGNYKSDFQINAPIINYLLLIISRIEGYFIQNLSIPVGSSMLCIAKKKP
ncbi:MAG: class I SAM-dependent methyltransferase [Patescibacteria group bacterium]